jgi:hypothetical protein
MHPGPPPPPPPPFAVTYFGPEATSPLHGCCECSSELLARCHPQKIYVALDFSEQTNPKKKDKKRSKYVALDFSTHFFFLFYNPKKR